MFELQCLLACTFEVTSIRIHMVVRSDERICIRKRITWGLHNCDVTVLKKIERLGQDQKGAPSLVITIFSGSKIRAKVCKECGEPKPSKCAASMSRVRVEQGHQHKQRPQPKHPAASAHGQGTTRIDPLKVFRPYSGLVLSTAIGLFDKRFFMFLVGRARRIHRFVLFC